MDTFIKHLDDEVNNLDEKQVNDILNTKQMTLFLNPKIMSSKTTQIVLETRRT